MANLIYPPYYGGEYIYLKSIQNISSTFPENYPRFNFPFHSHLYYF